MNAKQVSFVAMLAFFVGFMACATAQDASQPMTAQQAENLARRLNNVSLPQTPTQNPYIREVVRVADGREVIILEDHKRNRLCYISVQSQYNDPAPISCGPLFLK